MMTVLLQDFLNLLDVLKDQIKISFLFKNMISHTIKPTMLTKFKILHFVKN